MGVMASTYLRNILVTTCMLLVLTASSFVLHSITRIQAKLLTLAVSTASSPYPYASASQFANRQPHYSDHIVSCAQQSANPACNLAKLNFRHSTGFTLSVQRFFDSKMHKAPKGQLSAPGGNISLLDASISNGQTIFDAPKLLTFTFDKAVQSGDIELSQVAGESRQKLPIIARTGGGTITVKLSKPLARNSSFEMSIKKIISPDGSRLKGPLAVAFQTSGGPKVTSTNINETSVPTKSKIVLTFDAPVSTSQHLDKYIKLEVNGTAAPVTLARDKNQVTISPVSELPKCAQLQVRVLDGLENTNKVSGGSTWEYQAHTTCQDTFTIGRSVQGREISAHKFGNGNSTVVFVGTTHGDEQSSTQTLESLIDYLERNPREIPNSQAIVIIPKLNPDGYAANGRTNAHNIDLNRNFPTKNWKRGVVMPGGSFSANGGGKTPLQEPESKALADYILKTKPRLVLTYHAVAGVVIPNNAGNSIKLAKIYEEKSDLNYKPNELTNQIFDYDTTGSLEEWLYDKHGIPAILVELWTQSSNEFDQNKDAMRAMIRAQ